MLLGVRMRGFSRCVCVCFLVWLSGAYNKESSLSKDYHLHQNSDIHVNLSSVGRCRISKMILARTTGPCPTNNLLVHFEIEITCIMMN